MPPSSCTRKSGLEVPDRRLTVDEELVHQCLPRADRQSAREHECPDALLRLRPDLEVVIRRRELPVEREPQPLVGLELVQHVVDDVHERDPEGLERAVPLPIPVRMWDEEDQR